MAKRNPLSIINSAYNLEVRRLGLKELVKQHPVIKEIFYGGFVAGFNQGSKEQ